MVPAVDASLGELKALRARDGRSERARVEVLFEGWSRFIALRETGVLAVQGITGALGRVDRLSTEISRIFAPLRAITQHEVELEATRIGQAHARALAAYGTSRWGIWLTTIGAFVVGIGSVLLLTRNVVPRIRRFSEFASAVADGDLNRRLSARGSDELARLGRALDEMVQRRAIGSRHEAVQREFVDALQVTDSEETAHDLLKRQLKRSISASSVVVLNRNNSETGSRQRQRWPATRASGRH